MKYGSNVKFLAMESGGVRVLAFTPILEEILNRYKMLPDHLAGTSGGAVMAFLCSIGVEPLKIQAMIASGLLDKMSPRKNLFMANSRLGLRKTDAMESTLRDLLFQQIGARDITFRRLADLTGYHLHICALNITLGVEQVFSFQNTPEQEVVSTVVASSAIPIYFAPVKIGNFLYVDGGMCNPLPIGISRSLNILPCDCLGMKIQTSREITGEPFVPDGIFEMLDGVLDVFMRQASNMHVSEELFARTVIIPDMGVKSTEFDMSDKSKSKLLISGYSVARKMEWEN